MKFFLPLTQAVVTGAMPAPPASRGHMCRKYRRETRNVRFCVLGLASSIVLANDRLRLAVEAGRMYGYEWDVATDAIVRSASPKGRTPAK
jgi:hypothetical protein